MRVESVDAQHAIGTADRLLLCIWRGETQPEAVAGLRAVARDLKDGADGFAMLTVVEAGAAMPGVAIRIELAKIFWELRSSVTCSALVFQGEGLRAAIARQIAVGISLLARQPFPHEVFATVPAAAAWISERTGMVLGSAGTYQAATELRLALDELRPC